ncbi:hypothetical protein A3J19_03565 [Candidatus Daviesbacteria bacterium RIFCSPLOWO2_02_FULL_41_8]|uniref:Uncharacterized protein n=2 Tax=Candidatus Daviesiibacteriota TaxID=1752718 RepID=A0A1F5NHT4_9BACT|nr:MAG: hypothetical protein A3D83_04080 [Candidatus Daviesbacteria bacterium RIFCSPHIGHO2_02_FULL_41_10]OGE76980.1 MAG: hypothetical protein A3J19_03565 [Candidatus Daviesbacteria bacterium RIFCSPLOWO2_02_FULL_41_8]
MAFELNEKQKVLIKEYRELITYGYQKMSGIQLDFKKVRVRKRVLYFMMGAMQSFSESILKLMGTEPVYEKPGESFLRSQLEIWLNMRFIYSSRSEDKARLFLSDLVMESLTYAKKHKTLWEKYPLWDMEFGTIKKSSDWEKFISDNVDLLKKYRKEYKDKHVTKLPNLYDRTLAIDSHLKKIGTFSEKNSAEKFYTLFYPYFSQSTHANMSGLQRYMRGTIASPEPFLDVDSKPEDAERILSVSYQGYFAVLHFFLQVFNAYSPSEYDRFKQYSKGLIKK